MSDSRLVEAIKLATAAHAGQVDKCGQPFIGHPLRVMARGITESEMIVGVLHDVVEDTDVTWDDLYYSTIPTWHELKAIKALTRNAGETYKEYIARVAKRPLAVAVKRNDILDNADPTRGWSESPVSRYRWAWGFLFPNNPLPPSLEKSK